MGKRGPKPGHGGRPVEYNDSYHVMMRSRQREYNRRLRFEKARQRKLNELNFLLEKLETNKKTTETELMVMRGLKNV